MGGSANSPSWKVRRTRRRRQGRCQVVAAAPDCAEGVVCDDATVCGDDLLSEVGTGDDWDEGRLQLGFMLDWPLGFTTTP